VGGGCGLRSAESSFSYRLGCLSVFGRGEERLKPIRAALSFAYKHWDVMDPFAKIDPPIQKEPQIRYLLLADIRRLLDYLKNSQQGYGSALAFYLANTLFQTACNDEEENYAKADVPFELETALRGHGCKLAHEPPRVQEFVTIH
jgi:hypothetical protein